MTSAPAERRGPDARAERLGAWLLVAAAVVWNLISLRAETFAVSYLDDSSVHEQMVRFATQQFRAGHVPLTTWFPFLGLGSPQFLHYQSLPAMLTGLLGLATGPDAAFRWTLYLLLSLWPVSVYLAGRMFGASRPAAAAGAAMSPFLASVPGIGYEQHAYVWTGFGVWTQLWASATLPLAWGLGWRAIRDGRRPFAAIALVALTCALHFETGYLALIPLVAWPFVAGRPLLLRLRRAALVLGGSLLACAWVIVPLLSQRAWAATNQVLHGTALENGYGAGRVLGWLVSGQLLDHGRVPVVTVFAAIGLGLACWRGRTDSHSRALLVALGVCLLLSFGRATFGGLVGVIPGSADLFFRRFMMGVQLVGLLLAGRGAAWAAARLRDGLTRWWHRDGLAWPATADGERRLFVLGGLAAAVLLLVPAWSQLGAYDHRNAAAIRAQQHADATQGAQVDRLIAVVKRRGGGRTYAGMPTNWGTDFGVGAVPVFKYLEAKDVDEVGYTLRTASLMTIPEYYFDEADPSDYRLFGAHYLILPAGRVPPVPARLTLRAGDYALWTLDGGGYLHAGTIVGSLAADRTNVGVRAIPLLHSRLAEHGDYLRTAFDQSTKGSPLSLTKSLGTPPAGHISAESDHLDRGQVAATVRMARPGVVVLSSSFDPGWTATVDGRAARTEMVAPALVATAVPAGVHRVVFSYRGFRGYSVLLGLPLLLLVYALWPRRKSRLPLATASTY